MKWLYKVAEDDISDALLLGFLVAIGLFIVGYAFITTR